MKKIFIVISFISCLFLTGCWNFNELNDLAIVTGIAIEKENDKYKVSVQIMNAEANNTNANISNSTNEVTLSNTDVTLSKAIRGLTLKASQKMLLTHLTILVIDEKIAKEGIDDILDKVDRDPQSNKQFDIAISKGVKASDILKVTTPLVAYPSEKIANSLDIASNYDSSIKSVKYDEFSKILLEDGYDNTAPTLTITGDKNIGNSIENTQQVSPSAIIEISDTAIFKDTKLVGFLPKEYGIGFSSLSNNLTNTIFSFKCGEKDYAAIEITEEKKDIKVNLKDEKPIVDIKLDLEGNIEEFNCNLDLTKIKNVEKIENLAKKDIEKEILKTINYVTKNFESDIFGFGNFLYKSDYKAWHKVKDKWHTKLKDIKTNIDIKLILHRKGLTRDSIKDDIDEN